MTISANSQQKIDAYLKVLRKQLRGLSEEDSRDVVEEIRSHILDKAALAGDLPGAVASALTALGCPEKLANQYVINDLLTHAQVGRSPSLIVQSLFRWASLSFAGFCVLLSSLVGYFLAGSFALCALLKPFHPHSAGLWRLSNPADPNSFSLRIGFSSPPVGGSEILGWWIVPLGLIIGVGLGLLTFYFGLWSIRKFWRRRPLPVP